MGPEAVKLVDNSHKLFSHLFEIQELYEEIDAAALEHAIVNLILGQDLKSQRV